MIVIEYLQFCKISSAGEYKEKNHVISYHAVSYVSSE